MVIEWVIIGLFILIGLWMLKLEHHSRKIKTIIIILVGFMIYFSVVGIFTSEKVDLTNPRGIISAVYLYIGWIGQTTGNLWDIGVDTTHLIGNAIRINKTEIEKR